MMAAEVAGPGYNLTVDRGARPAGGWAKSFRGIMTA
jgi:hypothetical protein